MTNRSVSIDGIDLMPDLRIGGAWVEGPSAFDAVSPIDGRRLAGITLGTPDDAMQAVEAAHAAFPVWSGAGRARRADALRWLADEIDARREDLAMLECLDTGALLSDLKSASGVTRWADRLRRAAAAALEPDLDPMAGPAQVHHRPAGVCAILLPGFGALDTALWRLSGALAAGNTVVLKTSELAPLAGALLADAVRAAEEAGLPAGVVNVLHGPGHTLGSQLLADPRLARVAFTGQAATGRWVAQVAGATGVPVSLDLGGHGATVVLPGADLDRVVRAAVAMLRQAGQDCAAATRLVVHAPLLPELTDRLVDRLTRLVVGDPREAATELGPVLTEDRRARVLGAVDHAQVAGARVLCGGRRHDAGELYVQPTLVDRLDRRSPLLLNPLEGPVLTLQPATDPAEALALANDGPGMVGAAVFGPAEDALACARGLRAAQVWVNGLGARDWAAPWGGAGRAGQGRTGGRWGFDFYGDVQAIQSCDGADAQAQGSVG